MQIVNVSRKTLYIGHDIFSQKEERDKYRQVLNIDTIHLSRNRNRSESAMVELLQTSFADYFLTRQHWQALQWMDS